MSDVPQRIGDAERDQAVQELQAHHAAGRLDLVEFEERMQAALQARTVQDLIPLFHDLPRADAPGQTLAVPRPQPQHASSVTAAKPVKTPAQRQADLVVGLMFPLALIINFVFGFEWWWLFLVPVFVGPVIKKQFGGGTPTDKRKEIR